MKLIRASAPPTLMQVARLAGVGIGTASRALTGNDHVSAEAQERVREAAQRLGYVPNEVARSLRAKRSNVVGIVVPDIGGIFMIECVRALQAVLRQHGYMSVIAFTDGVSATEREEIDYLIRRQIDGFLIVPADSSAPHLNSPKMVSIPRVFFDQPVDDSSADAVLVKNRQAARIAVEHLIEHGHRHIACIGINRHLYSVRKRIQGYRDAMKAAGLSDCVAGPDSAGIDAQIGKWLRLKNKPTAIFSLNEGSTVKVIESLANHRVPIPTGMAFIGFDEVMFGNFLESPLTTIVQPATEIGERAAQLLLERIESGEALPGKHILLNPSFIRRGSCGCNPAQPTVSYLLDTHQSHPVIS